MGLRWVVSFLGAYKMKYTKFLAAIFIGLVMSSQAQADGIVETAKLAAQACINGLSGKSQDNSFLLNYGFQQNGKKYIRKSTVLGLSGHTDRASISMRRNTSCSFSYGTNRGAHEAHEAFKAVFRNRGYEERIVKDRNRQRSAFVVNGALIEIMGSEGSAHSSYFTEITAFIRG